MSSAGLFKSAGPCRTLGVILGVALGLIAFKADGQQKRTAQSPKGQWEVLEGCSLSNDGHFDGDSFQVEHKGRTYRFRLYDVDAPEADETLKQRIVEQAAYFGVVTSDIPRGGKLAAEFSLGKLKGHQFKVVTRWHSALGMSARYYCVVLVKGENLAEKLVAQGLARVQGPRSNWPDEPTSRTFQNGLRNLELEARQHRRGLWDEKIFSHAPMSSPKSPKTSSEKIPFEPVNINTASVKELEALPGIGPKLAASIIAYRPYRTVDELLKVPGIGPTKLDQIRGFVITNAAGK